MSASKAGRLLPRVLKPCEPKVSASLAPDCTPKLMEHLAQGQKLLSMPVNSAKNVATVGGERSYVLLGSLARLEKALMRWTMKELISKHKFKPVVVPNIIHDHIIDRCGFPTDSQRSQVYKIPGTSEESLVEEDSTTLSNKRRKSLPCIAGTSEFALASIHIGDSIPAEELPKKYIALSRCYRAETSDISSEWGIYRVHYFSKVEMFAFTMPNRSEEMHEEFLSIEKDLFDQLSLQYQVLDMPDDDLGLSAKRKFDIEAWLPGRKRFGEISSTSNCEDYQSSRLDIKYSQMIEKDDQLTIDSGFVHTVNGTACSSIRTLIALFEQHQRQDGSIEIPQVLVPFMNNERVVPAPIDADLLNSIDIYSTLAPQ